MNTYNLYLPIQDLVSKILGDEKKNLLNNYFLVTIESYTMDYHSGISEDGKIDSYLSLKNKNNTYKFYYFQIPNIDFKFEIENPFEQYSQGLTSLMKLESIFPQIKNIQTSLYRNYLFPNINYGLVTDSISLDFQLDFNLRLFGLNEIIDFLKQILTETQIVISTTKKESKLLEKIEEKDLSISELNNKIKQVLDNITSWIDVGINTTLNVRSVRLQNYIYRVKFGELFTIPQCGLTDFSFSYKGLIKNGGKYIPETISVNLKLKPIYPIQVNEKGETEVIRVGDQKQQVINFSI